MDDSLGPLSGPELDLEVPSKPEYVRTVRLTVGALARQHDVPDEVVEEIKLAVSEAVTGAVAANAEADSAEPVRILSLTTPSAVMIEVLDRGPEPEREVAGPPVDIDTGDLPFDKSLSLPLIRGLVDEVAVTPREGGGASVRMVVSLERSEGPE